jgi:hypothetical protein
LESANINQETLEAMKNGAAALQKIHGKMCDPSIHQAILIAEILIA